MNLSDKIALVTGSARGIGRAVALKLASAGATVVVSDIEDAGPVAAEIMAMGKQALALKANVSLAVDVEAMFKKIEDSYGKLDILVNNAGITRDHSLLRIPEADWDAVLNVDLKSVYLCSQSAVRLMLKQHWGRIVSVSSIIGLVGNAGQTNYAAAKAGIIGFTKSLAKEVAAKGITVNAVAPGYIDTPMTQGLPEAVKQEFMKRIPMGIPGTPEDVAGAISLFMSDDAKYITGQVLAVDGGWGGG